MVKLIVLMRRKPSLSEAEFHRYWREEHARTVVSVKEFARYLRKYVQWHTVKDFAMWGTPGLAPFDGVAELWFDSMDDLNKALNEPRYLEVVRTDEAKFMDLPNCQPLIMEKVPIIDG